MSHYDPDSFDNRTFDAQARTRLVFGAGTIKSLGRLVRELGARTALIVTDPGLRKTGSVDRAVDSLNEAGLRSAVFDQIVENPTTDCVNRCVSFAKSKSVDVLIGFGGGSSIDTAKGAAFLFENDGEMKDYWGYGNATKPMPPIIAVPTTAGTGSEVQSFALISDAKSHMKMACGDPKAAPTIAILDPELTTTLPRSVTANTGIDAMAHAVESAVTKVRNPFSSMYAERAFQLTFRAFPKALDEPNNLEARGDMLLGATLAGLAIENSMLGAAHSMANPLTAHYDIVHGQAVGVALPHVIRYNAEIPEARAIYQTLARFLHTEPADRDPIELLINAVEQALALANIPNRLKEHGVEPAMASTLAHEAATQWTRQFNPRPIEQPDFEKLYRAAL